MYDLAREHLEFGADTVLFSEQRIARMIEVEFVSEVIAASWKGLTG